MNSLPSYDTQQVEPLPSEVVAFCTLLARIMYRCLLEQDVRIMALLNAATPQGSEAVRAQIA